METSNLTGKTIQKYLNEGKRFDERKLEEFRDIEVEVGVSKNAEGSARVKIGKTEVIVGIKLDVTTPYPDSPTDGNLMVTTELLPLSSPRFELGPPKIDSIELGRITDRMIRESKFIQLDKLCIKAGEKVWNIFIDIYSLNDDGNLLDAAGIGAVIALKNTKIPKYDAENEKVLRDETPETPLPTSNDIPLSFTFHKIGDSIIVDPTREEEDFSESRLTIGTSGKYISSMQKGDEKELTPEEFKHIVDLSTQVWKDISKKIEKYLK